jgi:hypothetical protein
MMKNRPLLAAIAGSILLAVCLLAIPRVRKEPHVNVAMAGPRPEDVSTIEGIVRASYETISGGVGVPRQWSRDRSLYDPNVRFAAVRVNPETKAIAVQSVTHQQYVDASDGFMVKEGFEERELGQEIHRFGNVATVLSSYEGKVASTGKVVTRGVNIFQLYFDGQRWWILSMTWDQERADNPIPAKLLAKM